MSAKKATPVNKSQPKKSEKNSSLDTTNKPKPFIRRPHSGIKPLSLAKAKEIRSIAEKSPSSAQTMSQQIYRSPAVYPSSDSNDEEDEVSDQGKQEILQMVENSSPSPIHQLLTGAGCSLGESITESNDQDPIGSLDIPSVAYQAPPTDKGALIEARKKDDKWYPHQNMDSIEGQATKIYLEILFEGSQNESQVFSCLANARSVVDSTGCYKSYNIWRILDGIIGHLAKKNLPDIASDICNYLVNSPEVTHVYLKGIKRLLPLVSGPIESLSLMEERITSLVSVVTSVIEESKAHQEEGLKFASQMSNMSSNIAGMQELLEQTVIKVSKLDVLPGSMIVPSSIVSAPSTPRAPESSRVPLISFKAKGEYMGPYNLKVDDGKILSIDPPSSLPMITELIHFKPKIQEIFINLDQTIIINKLLSRPILKQAFTNSDMVVKESYMRELCKGVIKKSMQWSKILEG